MEEQFENTFKQAAAFQKMWMDSVSGMTRVWSEYSPEKPPPDELKKVRQGMLRSISQSWEAYMRSPEFLQAMRETMNNSIQWQKWTKENSRKFHQAAGSASKDDMQGVMVAIQHVERRVLDCLDEMQTKVNSMQVELDGIQEEGNMSLELYQQEVLERLAKLEKSLANGTAKAANPPAPKSQPAKKAAVKKKAAPAKKAARKRTVKKVAQSKPKKAEKSKS